MIMNGVWPVVMMMTDTMRGEVWWSRLTKLLMVLLDRYQAVQVVDRDHRWYPASSFQSVASDLPHCFARLRLSRSPRNSPVRSFLLLSLNSLTNLDVMRYYSRTMGVLIEWLGDQEIDGVVQLLPRMVDVVKYCLEVSGASRRLAWLLPYNDRVQNQMKLEDDIIKALEVFDDLGE